MSQKLLKYQKEQLVKSVLDDAFAKREKVMIERERALARRARAELLGPHQEAYLGLPDWARSSVNSARVNVNGQYHRLFGGEDFVTPGKRLDNPSRPLAHEIELLSRDEGTLDEERSELRAKVKAIVNSVTTTKKLLEVWPEAEPYLPVEPEPPRALVDVNQVNRLIKRAKGT